MNLFKAIAEWLTRPSEGGSVTMWDCPWCPALFWSKAKADKHARECQGE